MKKAVQKSRIPAGKAFVIKELIAPYFDVNWHFHSEYQLFVVLKGEGTRFIGDHIQRFQAGDMVLTGPNLPHLWRSDQIYFQDQPDLETHGIVIYFPDHFLNNAVFDLEEFGLIGQLLQTSASGVGIVGETQKILINRMKNLLKKEGVGSIIQLLEILEIIAKSTDCQLIADPTYVNLHKESEGDRMGLVYELVMKRYTNKITLKEAADLCNLSESAFSRYFKSRANQSFSDFLSQVRIHQACKLLQEDKLNISQICFECGFFTLSNFNRQFKERMGKTPLEYRNEFLR
ncbi:AraC family transcriptional regulator [Algoriphagus marinus]|uniref:AraC family transcriptional regulator n=1 Tax=Algoriphagus marinus TaxID=1925762 RepID=UPI00094B7E95|nr:AraC family transcriptional regulator [Algoriphagus marinus]